MLQIQGVTKDFGKVRAVDDLNFTVESGDIFGLLGPNGAGKTTMIRMIMQIFQPDSGSIRLHGKPVTPGSKDDIGYLPEERGLYQKMKIREVIHYFASLKRMDSSEARKVADDYLERFELLSRADDNIEELSKGNQQKIQFIISVMHAPKLLILDEPFSGLDPVNQVVLKEIITELQEKGTTVLLSTHQMEQVEKLCEKICLINKGAIVLKGNLKQIKRDYGSRLIRVISDVSLESLAGKDIFNYTEFSDGTFTGELKDNIRPEDYLKELAEEFPIRKFEVVEPTLEQIFIEQVKGARS
jgi:ABC-2 type transport system ATP-binding protein